LLLAFWLALLSFLFRIAIIIIVLVRGIVIFIDFPGKVVNSIWNQLLLNQFPNLVVLLDSGFNIFSFLISSVGWIEKVKKGGLGYGLFDGSGLFGRLVPLLFNLNRDAYIFSIFPVNRGPALKQLPFSLLINHFRSINILWLGKVVGLC
jgi:hypothetical protein